MSDWYLVEWLKTCGKKQADIVRDLDWNKAKVSMLARSKQRYTRDEVNALSAYLMILPYELLMHPTEALALRQMRNAARDIVASDREEE